MAEVDELQRERRLQADFPQRERGGVAEVVTVEAVVDELDVAGRFDLQVIEILEGVAGLDPDLEVEARERLRMAARFRQIRSVAR